MKETLSTTSEISDLVDANPFQTQTGRVYEVLRSMIFSGELRSGELLPLVPLAERLGVSVTPLRDALRTLDHQGLIEKRSRSRYQVVRMTAERVEGYEVVREALFVQAARRAAERITDADIAALTPLAETLDAMIIADTTPETREILERDFHRRIARISSCRQLEKEMIRLGVFGNLVRALGAVKQHLHKGIVDALATRDPATAEEAMRVHCTFKRQEVLEAIEALESEDDSAERGHRTFKRQEVLEAIEALGTR